MIDVQRIARHYGGDVSGGQALIPAIGHSKADRGVAIKPDASAPDGCLVHCFNGGDALAEKDRLRADGFLPAFEPTRRVIFPPVENTAQRAERLFAPPKRTPFDFTDADGVVLYRKVRIDRPGRDKSFVFEHLKGGIWTSGRGCAAVPYRMAELNAAPREQPLYLAEGEAKADRLASWGLLASCSKDFPGEWAAIYFPQRDVIILPDNDEPGFAYARKAAEQVEFYSGRPLVLPPFPGVGPGGDVLDWDGDREALEALVAETLATGGQAALKPDPASQVFALIDAADLGDQPAPPRRFMTEAFEPWGSATLLTGAGATGKSLLSQQWMTCTALGLPFMGLETVQCPSLYLTCEDDAAELHRRQEGINRALGIRPADLRGKLYLFSQKGQIGNELCTFGSEGKMVLTDRWGKLLATVERFGIKHLALDNTAHLFAGNENDRHHVAGFAGLLDRLAQEIDGAVLFLGHPNKAGDEFSGSTAWENQVRSRLFLSLAKASDGSVINPDGRTLSNSKPNYSQRGKAVEFIWHDWAFYQDRDLPQDRYAELGAAAVGARDNDLFLACLAERTRQKRAVSEKRSSTFAPLVFASMPESKKIGKARLEAAMDRLFRIDKIERGELPWKQDRKLVQGIRLKRADGCADGAQTLCADAGDYA